ncbi:glycosyl transferase family 28 [Prauserella marina]|uniref:Glycosyltransferase/glycosyltransferase n=1 Tax=Prauserella marina TaxID=530584 RepID=A0A222VLV9_9PSEU|nr:activator-dependent family glycosyltransferase [Prauserella marina]ASR34874.1 glycosyl transferase family 28 [Prauserella marina]PWV85427.1 glycosyltransferase/glycosyltransferase [Prauserella marina]SDC55067.1 glycosyltransferase/glycosyltransferase [Prauserella marina]
MRILITSFALDAHFNGAVPLAWALRTAGHEVRVASQPALTESITQAGLTAIPVGSDHRMHEVTRRVGASMYAQHSSRDFLEHRPELLDLDFHIASNSLLTATYYMQINNDSMVDELVDFARNWKPDLVIWELFTFAGAVAARAAGAAHARILSFPDTFYGVRKVFLQRAAKEPEQYDDSLEEWLTLVLERHGCEFDEEVVTGQWTIDQMPVGVRLPLGLPTVEMRYLPYNGPTPAVVPDWLRVAPTRPRVCFTLGETIRQSEFPNAVKVADLFEAIENLDIEVVALLSEKELEGVPKVPGNTRVVDRVPLAALMPSCSAIVHHGGAGTWATAAAYGVPQVAMGWMWDAIYRAQRLEELGAGLHIPSFELTVEKLREKLVRVLEEPSFTEGAQRLRDVMAAAASPNETVPVLERLTTQHRAG